MSSDSDSNTSVTFLRTLYELTSTGTFACNSIALLKDSLFRGNERLVFLLRRYKNKSIDISTACSQVHDFLEKHSAELLTSIFKDCSLQKAKDISKADRSIIEPRNEKSFTYGEIDFTSFYRVLRDIPDWTNKRGVFYDLGSGTGRAVVAARVLCDFSVCKGIELLPGLHSEASSISQIYCKSSHCFSQYFGISTDMQFYSQSITEYDWEDGDVVFANSTCFSDFLMKSISEQAERVKKDTLFISFTKPLQSDQFEIFRKVR